MNERWRLEELVQLAGQALKAAPYDGQSSRRVRELPDARTIRYYTTIGILDRPLEMRGRTAYYGRRHLMQIVAVKRLQARGMALVDIQKNIAGADSSRLNRWAALPAGFWEAALAHPAQRPASPSPDDLLTSAPQGSATAARARFWAAAPAIAEADDRAVTALPLMAKPAVVLPLAPGVSLIIEGRLGRSQSELPLGPKSTRDRSPNDDHVVGRPSPPPETAALDAIQPALAGLLAALVQAGIIDEDDRDQGPRRTTTNQGDGHGP